jgi:molybdopterin-guanine dinucleotide biosynthesis protein A
MLVDEGGRTQPLLAAYRTAAVRSAVEGHAGSLQGRRLHGLLSGLWTLELPAERDEALDCDTPDDLARARRLATARAVTGQR